MARKIKAWSHTSPPPSIPREWAALLGLRHHYQADVDAYAPTKADVERLLLMAGESCYTAESIARGMRWERDGRLGNDMADLIERGFIDPEVPAVYVHTLVGTGSDPRTLVVDAEGPRLLCTWVLRKREGAAFGMDRVPVAPDTPTS